MIRSGLKSPYKGWIPTTQVRPGLYAAPEADTGEYRFFAHSDPEFYIQGRKVEEFEYRQHVSKILLSMYPPKNNDMETMCVAMSQL